MKNEHDVIDMWLAYFLHIVSFTYFFFFYLLLQQCPCNFKDLLSLNLSLNGQVIYTTGKGCVTYNAHKIGKKTLEGTIYWAKNTEKGYIFSIFCKFFKSWQIL